MGQKIGNIFLVILVAGLVVYFVRSGLISSSFNALKSTSFNGSSSSFPGILPLSEPAPAGSASQPSSIPESGTETPPAPVSNPIVATSSINPSEIPQGFTAAQLSPYFQDVRFAGVSYGGYSYNNGQITLNAYWNTSGTVDITGWQIKSRDGGEYIPQAVNVYDPSGLSPASDIVMKSGDTVYLFSSPGPFNLRLNECIGYIATENQTSPELPESCPSMDYSQVQQLSGECQNYLDSIGSCQVPNLNTAPISRNDYACVNYVETLNYKGCFDAHLSDPNFLSNQIWVWMGSNVVDQYHDQVELLDRNGLVVDVYTY